jgi:hypothetical protein
MAYVVEGDRRQFNRIYIINVLLSAPHLQHLGGTMSIFAWSALLLARGGEQQQSGRARRENITVYRVTPVNLKGVSDRNTGDAGALVHAGQLERVSDRNTGDAGALVHVPQSNQRIAFHYYSPKWACTPTLPRSR